MKLSVRKRKAIKEAMRHPDKPGEGAKKRKKIKDPQDKVHVVMEEFARGTLRSSSGQKVTNPKQALAIGYSEARRRSPK